MKESRFERQTNIRCTTIYPVSVWSEARLRHKNTSWDVFKDESRINILATTEHHGLTTLYPHQLVAAAAASSEFASAGWF